MFGKTKKRLDYLERKVLELEHRLRNFEKPTEFGNGPDEKAKEKNQPSLGQIVDEWFNGKGDS